MNEDRLTPASMSAARETAEDIFARIQRRRGLPETLPGQAVGAPGGAPSRATRNGPVHSTPASQSARRDNQPDDREGIREAHTGTTSATGTSGREHAEEQAMADLRAAMAQLRRATGAQSSGASTGSSPSFSSSGSGFRSTSSASAGASDTPSGAASHPEAAAADLARRIADLERQQQGEYRQDGKWRQAQADRFDTDSPSGIHDSAFRRASTLQPSLLVDEDGIPIDEELLREEQASAFGSKAEAGAPADDIFPRSQTMRLLLRYPTAATALGLAMAIPAATLLLRNHTTRKALYKTGKLLAEQQVWKQIRHFTR